jgi:hypothetical protein
LAQQRGIALGIFFDAVADWPEACGSLKRRLSWILTTALADRSGERSSSTPIKATLPAVPIGAAPARDPAAHCPARHRQFGAAGTASLGNRRTLAWFSRFRRLTIRYERRIDIVKACHHLAAALICQRFC